MNPGPRLDRYEIVDKIGEGGMGAVYRARDTSLDREVAAKVLPPSFTADEVGVVNVATGERVDFRILVEYSPESPNVAYGRGRWMPGDKAIAFIGVGSDAQPNVWIQDFIPGQDTTATRRPPEGMAAAGIIESFGVSPDGTRFALSTIQITHVLKRAEGLGPLR